jgi:hypothetical protein
LPVDYARDFGVGYILDGISAARVFRNANIVIVGMPGDWVVHDIFEDGTKAYRVVDFRFLLGRKVDAFGIAATLNVEDTCVRPNVFIVTDEKTIWVSRQGGLASS